MRRCLGGLAFLLCRAGHLGWQWTKHGYRMTILSKIWRDKEFRSSLMAAGLAMDAFAVSMGIGAAMLLLLRLCLLTLQSKEL